MSGDRELDGDDMLTAEGEDDDVSVASNELRPSCVAYICPLGKGLKRPEELPVHCDNPHGCSPEECCSCAFRRY